MEEPKSVIKSREEAQYWEIFEKTVRFLEMRRRKEPRFTARTLREYLKTAYLRQDMDWLGNGAVFEITQAAIVAAYEQVLAEWEAETPGTPPETLSATPGKRS